MRMLLAVLLECTVSHSLEMCIADQLISLNLQPMQTFKWLFGFKSNRRHKKIARKSAQMAI